MTETNALAEGAASTSSDQTKNDQPSPETTPTTQPTEAKADAKSDGEGKPAEDSKRRTASERIAELKRERDEAEVRSHVSEQKQRAAQNEIRRLQRLLEDGGVSEAKRMALESRVEEKRLEIDDARAALDESRTTARQQRLDLFSEKVGDADVVERFCRLPRVSEELADLVAESDFAAQLAAKLANDPKEARRLSGLAPHRLGAELARLERSFEGQPDVRRVSQAPEPSSRLRGGSSPAAKSLYDPSVSIEEYASRRMPEIMKARR